MLLVGFLVFGLILETSNENLISENKDTFKHTLAINSLAAVGSLFAIVLHSDLSPAPGVNFELGIKNNFSVNFEIDLNNIFFLILPVEGEIGLRKYLQEEKEFWGFYLYQGIAWGWINLIYTDPARYGKIAKYLPNLIFAGGYKYVFKSGFTIDPFLVLRLIYGGKIFSLGQIGFVELFPLWGLYLGYSW